MPPRNSKFVDQESVATQQVGRASPEPARGSQPKLRLPLPPACLAPAATGPDPPPTLPQAGLSGQQLRKVQRPASQGVYNPITNAWVVPPANKRILEGLSFSPASLFKAPRAQAGLLAAGTGASR